MLFSALLAFGAGCYVDDPQVRYSGGVAVNANAEADLVEVSPGVEVVADYNEPVFFADDYYWAYRGGIWYQSGYYGGGWRRAGYVPGHITSIRHPEGYAHFRPNGYARGTYRNGGHVTHANGSYRVRSAPHGRSHR